MMTMVSHEHAVEVDTALAQLYVERHKIHLDISYARSAVRRIAGDRQDRNGRWSIASYGEAETLAKEKAQPWDHLDRQRDIIKAGQLRLDEIYRTETPLEDEFKGNPWARFFLVTSSAGHIHSSMGCSSCYPQTTYAWLPDLSGLEMAAAVEAHGEILCSICFPDAPVAWTIGEPKAKVEEREKRAAEKAERDAKKLAKALLPDGSEYVAQYGERRYDQVRLSTLHSAKSWLTDTASYNRSYPRDGYDSHPSHPIWVALEVAELVAAKTGETADEVIAAAVKRANKRDGVR